MNTKKISYLSGVLLLSPIYAQVAHSEVYMSEQKAAELIFPNLSFEKTSIELQDADVDYVEQNSKEKVRSKKLVFFKSKDNSIVFIDQVLGKHEFITYAVGITPEAKVKAIEIIEYRESYGHQIRKESWRDQFKDKDIRAELALDHDIKNLSGATLSCAHISAGVKRLLFSYEKIKSKI